MKSANHRYLEFVSSFDYRDLSVLEAISRGEYMTFGMQGKNIRRHLPEITPSAMTRIFKRLKVHGLIEKLPGFYKYLITALGKEIIAVGLTVKNLILVPSLAF